MQGYIIGIVVVVGFLSAAFGAYQLRATVNSVEEIFTDDKSSLTTIAFTTVAGLLITYLITRKIAG